MGNISKILKNMSGLKAGTGFRYFQAYREKSHVTISKDEVIFKLCTVLFPKVKLPDEISVIVEWKDPE